MADDSALDDLVARFDAAAFRSALTEAFHRGVMAERARMLKLLDADANVSPRVEKPRVVSAEPAIRTPRVFYGGGPATEIDPEARRAPKGLTREVVSMLLTESPGLTIDELQAQGVALEPRLSPKTIYNELNREKGKLYHTALGRWYLGPSPSETPEAGDEVSRMFE